MLTRLQLKYLKFEAQSLIEGDDEPWIRESKMNILWRRMTTEERDETNSIVADVFGEWL